MAKKDTRNIISDGVGTSLKYFAAISAILMINIVFTPMVNEVSAETGTPINGETTIGQDWVIEPGDAVNRVQTEIILNSNLIVEEGGYLGLSGTSLLSNCSFDGEFHIDVYGTLEVRDGSVVAAKDGTLKYDFTFHPGSTGQILDSTIMDVGYSSGGSLGLRIESSDVRIENSIIENNYYGLILDNSAPTIIGNEILNNQKGILGLNVPIETSTLTSGDGEGEVLFPEGGGLDDSLSLSLPASATVTSASIDITGIPLSFSDVITHSTSEDFLSGTLQNVEAINDDVMLSQSRIYSIEDGFDGQTPGSNPVDWTVTENELTTHVDITGVSCHGTIGECVNFIDSVKGKRAEMERSFTPLGRPNIEFSIKMEKNTERFEINLKDGNKNALFIRFNNDGNIQIKDGPYRNLIPYEPQTWYNFKIDMNTVTKDFNIFIDPDPIYPPTTSVYQGTLGNSINQIDNIFFASGKGKSSILTNAWVDDVGIYEIHYSSLGTLTSTRIAETVEDIYEAEVAWDETLNGQYIDVYVTNNDGTNWYWVSNGERFVFPIAGGQLHYSVLLSTVDVLLTPVLHSITVDYTLTSLPPSPSLDVGGDGDVEWSVTGIFDYTETFSGTSFVGELNSHIDAADEEAGAVEIPLLFSSDALLSITVSNILITYDIWNIEGNDIHDNGIGISIENSNVRFTDNQILNNTYGMEIISSSPFIQSCTIAGNTFWDIDALTDSRPSLLDTLFSRGKVQIQDSSEMSVSWLIDIIITNPNGVPVEGESVIITNDGGEEVFNGVSGLEGEIQDLELVEYVQMSAAYYFDSPYKVSVGTDSEVQVLADSKKLITIASGGDSDRDGRTDIEENSLVVFSTEAENHALVPWQSEEDFLASGFEAIVHDSSGSIIDGPFIGLSSGDYQVFIKARQKGEGEEALLATVEDSFGTVIVAQEEHATSSDGIYRWFITSEFNLVGDTSIVIIIEDKTGITDPSKQNILVDNIMVIETSSLNPGQITDPLKGDTDGDFLDDGIEVRDDTYWLEAEHASIGSAIVASDGMASNGQVVQQEDGGVITLVAPSDMPSGTYEAKLRAGVSGTTSGIDTVGSVSDVTFNDVSWHPDGQEALLVGEDGAFYTYDSVTGTTVITEPLSYSRYDPTDNDFGDTGTRTNVVETVNGYLELDNPYLSDGLYHSAITATSQPISKISASWSDTVDVNQLLTVKVSSDGGTSIIPITNGGEVTTNWVANPDANKYLSYVVNFHTDDDATTPVLHSITLTYSLIHTDTTTSDFSLYSDIGQIDYSTDELKLENDDYDWTQTSDTDFDQGVYQSTVLAQTGGEWDVVLDNAEAPLVNLALGGPAVASNELPTNPATNSNDGILSSTWISNTIPSVGNPEWLEITMGQTERVKGVDFQLDSMVVPPSAPSDFEIYSQESGSQDWILRSTTIGYTGTSWSITFATSFSALKVKIEITSTQALEPAISEFRIHPVDPTSYVTNGIYTSAVFDASSNAVWDTMNWIADLPAGTGISVQIRTGQSTPPDGTWQSWTLVSNGGPIPAPPTRYIQYQVEFFTSVPVNTPALQSITLNHHQFRTPGHYISDQLPADSDVVSATTTWVGFTNGQTMSVYIRNDPAGTFQAISSGVQHTFSSAGQMVQYKIEMSTTDPATSPVIESITIEYEMERTDDSNSDFLASGSLLAGVQVENGDVFLLNPYLPTGTYTSSITQTPTQLPISSVTVSWNGDIPETTDMFVEVSNDNGVTWYDITPLEGQVFHFPTIGGQLRYKVTFDSLAGEESPILMSIDLIYNLDVDFKGVAWNPDGSYAILVGSDCAVFRWDGADLIDEALCYETITLQDIDWRPDGSMALLVGDVGHIYEYIPGIPPLMVIPNNHILSGGTLYAVKWNDGGSQAVIVGDSGRVFYYNPAIPDPVILIQDGLTETFRGVDWRKSAGSTIVTIVGEEGIVESLDTSTNLFVNLFTGTTEDLHDVGWLQNDRFAVIVGAQGTVLRLENGIIENIKDSGLGITDVYHGLEWRPDPTGELLFAGQNTEVGLIGKALSYIPPPKVIITFYLTSDPSTILSTEILILTEELSWYHLDKFDTTSAVSVDAEGQIANADQGEMGLDILLFVRAFETEGVLWSRDLSDDILSSPTVLPDGRILIGTNNNEFMVLDGTSQNPGTDPPIWSITLTDNVQSSPLVIGDLVIFGSNDNNIYAMELDPSDGVDGGSVDDPDGVSYDVIWKYQTGGDVTSSPVYYKGLIIVGSEDGTLYALDIGTGSLVWSFTPPALPFPYPLTATPAIDDGLVFFGVNLLNDYYNQYDNIFALDAESGVIIWKDSQECQFVTSFAVADDLAFVGCSNPITGGSMLAYKAKGDISIPEEAILDWTFPAIGSIGPIFSDPIVSQNKVIFGSTDKNVYALDEFTGDQVWSVSTSGSVMPSPAVANGMVFVGSDDFEMYYLDVVTGGQIWTSTTGGAIQSSAAIADIDSDGHLEVVFGSNDNKLYVLDGGGKYYKETIPWPMFRHDSSRSGIAQTNLEFYPTDPLNPDIDFDGLMDGPELIGYFGADRLEMEDVIGFATLDEIESSPTIGNPIGFKPWEPSFQTFFHQTGVTLTTSQNYPGYIGFRDSWSTLALSVSETNHYRLKITPNTNVYSILNIDMEGRPSTVLLRDRHISSPIAKYAERIMEEAFYVQVLRGDTVLKPVSGTETINPILSRVVVPDGTSPGQGPAEIWGWVEYSAEFNLSKIGIGTETDYKVVIGMRPLNSPQVDLLIHTSEGEEFPWLPISLVRILDLDYFRVEKQGLNPYLVDSDNDNLGDGFEATPDRYPLNKDADHDGLTDQEEMELGTDFGYRDTDYDGVRDAIELGKSSGEINGWLTSRASWTERIARDPKHNHNEPLERPDFPNWDADPPSNWGNPIDVASHTTNPFNPDDDEDGLPDGWRDGWFYNPSGVDPSILKSYDMNFMRYEGLNYWRYDVKYWGNVYDKLDNKIQIYEGEDLNLDGAVIFGGWGFDDQSYEANGNGFPAGPGVGDAPWNGEIDPTEGDTDGDDIPDGYETWYSHLEPHKSSNGNYILDPTNPNDAVFDKDAVSNEMSISSFQSTDVVSYDVDSTTIARAIKFTAPQNIENPESEFILISAININLDLKFHTPALLELWNGIDVNEQLLPDGSYDLSIISPDQRTQFGKHPLTVMDKNGDRPGIIKFDIKDQLLSVGSIYYIVMWFVDEETDTSPNPNLGYGWFGEDLDVGAPSYRCYYWEPTTSKLTSDDSINGFVFSLDTVLETPDGLENLQEYLVGSNPKNPDTDAIVAGTFTHSDGLIDGLEVLDGIISQGSHADIDGIFASPDDKYLTDSDQSGSVSVESMSNDYYLKDDGDALILRFTSRSSIFDGETITLVLGANVEGENPKHLQLKVSKGTSLATLAIDNSLQKSADISKAGTFLSWSTILIPSTPYYIKFHIDADLNKKIAFDSFTIIIKGESDNAMVIFRTNVEHGATIFDNYGQSSQYIDYDGDSASGTINQGHRFLFSTTITNPSTGFEGIGTNEGIIKLLELFDLSPIYLNSMSSPNEIYVWSPNIDFSNTIIDENGIDHVQGTVHIFLQESGVVPVEPTIDLQFWDQEIYLSNPFDLDSDDDGLADGEETGPNHPNLWKEDWDWKKDQFGNIVQDYDGVVCVRDSDSDNDGKSDGTEAQYNEDLPGPALDINNNEFFTNDLRTGGDSLLSFDYDDYENIIDFDSDGDGIQDGNEIGSMVKVDTDNDGIVDGFIEGFKWNDGTKRFEVDTDNGLYDRWEGEDIDFDGRTNEFETSPTSFDTDDDGVQDGFDIDSKYGELSDHHGYGITNQLEKDSDRDGLSDFQEIDGWDLSIRRLQESVSEDRTLEDVEIHSYSNPVDSEDTDLDGIEDKYEYQYSDATDIDTDNDGLDDNIEFYFGTFLINADTDNDGMLDGFVANSALPGEDRNNDGIIDDNEPNPKKSDSDNDGIKDRDEYDSLESLTGVNDGYTDSDNDGLIDLREIDSDNDGLKDGEENWNHDATITSASESDPTDYDSDDDGLWDGAEPYPMIDSIDGDCNVGIINVQNDNINCDSTDDYEQVFVVLRTNAIDNDGDEFYNYENGVWIAVDPNSAVTTSNIDGVNIWKVVEGTETLNLKIFTFIQSSPTEPSGLFEMATSYYDPTDTFDVNNLFFITSSDGSLVKFSDPTTIYIFDGILYHEFSGGGNGDTHTDNIHSESSYVKLHQETYEWRPIITDDPDFDGLKSSVEIAAGTDWEEKDSDGDGIIDGLEMDWDQDTDGDGLINALDTDSDGDGIDDDIEDPNKNGIVDEGESSPINADSDFDGLVDGWLDTDNDQVYDADEGEDFNGNGIIDIGDTDPIDMDSDDDGLCDGYEAVTTYPAPGGGTSTTSPTTPDSDNDNIFDGTEAGLTYPYCGDYTDLSQGNFISDNNPVPSANTNPIDEDSDTDSLLDGEEDINYNGAQNYGETKAYDDDTDGDTLLDGYEINTLGTNPLSIDTDGDSLSDNDEVNGIWVDNYLADGSTGNDGTTDTLYTSNPTLYNSDNDELDDGLEVNGWVVGIYFEQSLEKKNTYNVHSNPMVSDSDEDGVTDLDEFLNSGDPNSDDTDDDGISDSIEFIGGSALSGIEGSPPMIDDNILMSIIPVIECTQLGCYPSGWKISLTVLVNDNVGVESVKFSVTGENDQYGDIDTQSNTATAEINLDYINSIISGYDIKVTAIDVNDNGNSRKFHIDSIVEITREFLLGAANNLANNLIEISDINWIYNAIDRVFTKATSTLLSNQLKKRDSVVNKILNHINIGSVDDMSPSNAIKYLINEEFSPLEQMSSTFDNPVSWAKTLARSFSSHFSYIVDNVWNYIVDEYFMDIIINIAPSIAHDDRIHDSAIDILQGDPDSEIQSNLDILDIDTTITENAIDDVVNELPGFKEAIQPSIQYSESSEHHSIALINYGTGGDSEIESIVKKEYDEMFKLLSARGWTVIHAFKPNSEQFELNIQMLELLLEQNPGQDVFIHLEGHADRWNYGYGGKSWHYMDWAVLAGKIEFAITDDNFDPLYNHLTVLLSTSHSRGGHDWFNIGDPNKRTVISIADYDEVGQGMSGILNHQFFTGHFLHSAGNDIEGWDWDEFFLGAWQSIVLGLIAGLIIFAWVFWIIFGIAAVIGASYGGPSEPIGYSYSHADWWTKFGLFPLPGFSSHPLATGALYTVYL